MFGVILSLNLLGYGYNLPVEFWGEWLQAGSSSQSSKATNRIESWTPSNQSASIQTQDSGRKRTPWPEIWNWKYPMWTCALLKNVGRFFFQWQAKISVGVGTILFFALLPYAMLRILISKPFSYTAARISTSKCSCWITLVTFWYGLWGLCVSKY